MINTLIHIAIGVTAWLAITVLVLLLLKGGTDCDEDMAGMIEHMKKKKEEQNQNCAL